MDDVSVVTALRRGDEAVFQAVVRAHSGALFSFLARLSGDRGVAQELLQDTWLSLAQACRSLRDGTQLRPWLFTVARNAYWSHRRWSRLDLARLAELTLWRREDKNLQAPDQLADAAQATRRVEAALGGLPPKYREALLLVGVEGFEPTEAAKVLGVKPEAFRQRLTRARTALRGILGGDP